MRLSQVQNVSRAGLCAIAVGAGLLLERASLPPSETQAIEAMAARYVAETGGATTDCFARPSAERWAWIIVECIGDEGRFLYPVDEQGRYVRGVEFGT